MRNSIRSRRTVALALATAALGTALTFGSTGAAMAAGIPGSGPNQQSSSVTGSSAHPDALPGDMDEGLDFWQTLGWPNWHNIGTRTWFVASSFVNQSTHQQVQESVFTGGQYQDRDGSLRAFMNNGGAGPSSVGYTGTFQEYNTTVYTTQANSDAPRRDARRVVRALTTGDVWWTNDHYSTFHYMGRP
ncbi:MULTISPECIES: ribonuclease domain-containing protein [unclassified Streptomyces]|uniref:ribonuclease domain-containing protein n=1 Tax=unclassified Streptomyces TaxID=2593676 RepID=UPI00382D540D